MKEKANKQPVQKRDIQMARSGLSYSGAGERNQRRVQ